MEPEVAFGIVLRALRLENKMTQEELAFEAELQRHYISLLERGANSPTLKSLFKLANALNTPPEQLVARVVSELGRNQRRK